MATEDRKAAGSWQRAAVRKLPSASCWLPAGSPELLLIARLLDALIAQLQNNPREADKRTEKAWQQYQDGRGQAG